MNEPLTETQRVLQRSREIFNGGAMQVQKRPKLALWLLIVAGVAIAILALRSCA